MNVSLLGGWLPWTLRVLTVVLVFGTIGRRQRLDPDFLVKRLPLALVGAVLAGMLAYFVVRDVGGIKDELPWDLWFWLSVCALALALAVLCWRRSRWHNRLAGPPAMVLALLTAGLALNSSLGYYPTVGDMYGELTDQALPQEISLAQLPTVHGTTDTGRIVAVDIPATPSGFKHRTEYVYLPPVWFRTTHRPELPVIELIGGQYAVPDNWVRAGDAVKIADAYAVEHHGYAPVLVFTDASGGFKVDTECVNGVAGQAADHLAKDIPQYMVKTFGTASERSKWSVAGWSMGGTCAVVLSLAFPEVFGHFLDISGDAGPNMGPKQVTIDKLYGGDAAAYDTFDPLTVLARRTSFPKGLSGVFAVATGEDQVRLKWAHMLADAAQKDGVPTQIYTAPGHHSWTFAQTAFKAQLPWLAKEMQLPSSDTVCVDGCAKLRQKLWPFAD